MFSYFDKKKLLKKSRNYLNPINSNQKDKCGKTKVKNSHLNTKAFYEQLK